MADQPLSVAELIGDWVDGWSKSRSSGVPVRHDWGFSIEVGSDSEVGRFVLTDRSDETIRRVSNSVREHNFWIKVPRPLAEVAPLLSSAWELQAPQQLMTSLLVDGPELELPVGFATSTIRESTTAVQVMIGAPDGSVAARGRMGLGMRRAVADRIVTAKGHQRRGLGRAVMVALANAGVASGHGSAVLMASVEGRALYRALGWSDASDFTEARFVAS